MRRGVVVVFVCGLGCEAIAGYDSREPWSPAAEDTSVTPGDSAVSDGSSEATPDDGLVDTAPVCLPPKTLCGGACVDPTRAFDHCGACDARCPAGATCTTDVSGTRCVCPLGRVACGTGVDAACVDTTSDLAHCGACGVACGPGEVCADGACTCAAAVATCGATCVDTRSDPTACGACDGACGATEYCVGSTCKCRPGLVDCGGECVDTRSDPRHCGACGKTCSQVCWKGDCKPTCAEPGNAACSFASAKSCAHLPSDPLNCGSCGNACAANELCVKGGCTPYAPALGCTKCPCDACAALFGTSQCCPALAGQASPICVAGDACP